MNAPRILVIIGNPLADSLTHALATAYADAAREGGAEVDILDLAETPAPALPSERGQLRMPRHLGDAPLDPQAERAIAAVDAADHLVFFYPQWWGTYPAALKALIDRTFLSGFAFRYHEQGRGWDRLLTGRTARLVMTMDSPRLWNRLVYRNASETSLRRAILGYCGVKTLGVTRFGAVRHVSADTRAGWIATAASLGARDAGLPGRVRETVAV